MKKIDLPVAHFLLPCVPKKKICRKNYFTALPLNSLLWLRLPSFIRQSNTAIVAVCLFLLVMFIPGGGIYGQQVLGSFPEMEGGFENATAATQASTTVAVGTQLTSWTGANASSIPAINNSIVRTGTKSLQWITSSTSHLLFSKSANSTTIANATSYVVQFYWWKGYSGSAREIKTQIGPSGTSNLGTVVMSPTLGVSAVSTDWTKQTVIVTSGTNNTATRYGLVQFQPNGGSFSTSPGYLFDDFCVYAGSAEDNTAPADAISPLVTGYTANSINLGWTVPATGVDGGGYVVVRYAANPTSEPAPNPNGIYAVGSTIGTGTVVYIGTATSFNNTGLTMNTAYYYRVYVADKAFNYSPNPITVTGFTGIAAQTGISFTTPASCITDRLTISWTGPINFNAANYTQLAFLKAGSAVTTGTPTNAASAYTASSVFALGTAYQNDAAAYCIYNGDGTDASGNHSGLTITGLSPNTTYYLLLYNIQDAGTVYSAAATGNGTTLNSLAEPANNPGSFAKGAVTTANIPLTWTAAGGSPAPTGYLIQASNSATPGDPADFSDPANQTNISGGSANVKTGGTSYSSFTGFAPGTMYYFRINSYTNSSTCINFKASGPTINTATLPNAVTSPALSITGGTGTINWTTATGYSSSNNTTLVFVSSSTIFVSTPTTNPSGYTANTVFGAGTPYLLDPGAKCVYNGDGTSATITGLVSGTTYYVLILTVVSAANYDATYSYSAYTTTSTLYSNANEYTWIGGAAGDWQVGTNWTPTRSSPAAADVLIFNTAGNVTATNVLTQTIAKLSINAGDVTLQSSGATLTITHAGVASTDFTVTGSTSLTLGSTVSMTLGSNTTANIVGTLNVNSSNTYNTNGTSVVTTVAGTVNCYGTVTSTTAAKFVVINGGIYNHAKNGGDVPTGTWNTNSTCLITGMTTADKFATTGSNGQTFSKFIWDCASQNSAKGTSPEGRFVLGVTINSGGPYMVVTDSFIVKRTNGIKLQLTSSGGQRDFTVGNYMQYGGVVVITYDTDAGGEQRSLTVNNTFYVTDSLETTAPISSRFQIINNPNGTNNIIGRLYVKGNVEMHKTIAASILESKKDDPANPSAGEIWFTGAASQWAVFNSIAGNVDFVTNQTGTGATLGSNATANKFKLMQGTFFIGSNTLTINDVVSYPAPSTGVIGGSPISNLTMALSGNAGTVSFANGSRILKNLTQLTGNSVAIGTELSITAGASPGRDSIGSNATLTTNDYLILRSDINGTARMAQLPVTATVVGKVTVERYLPMNLSYDSRRWRLLTAPFKASTAPTINAAWQEGVSNPDRTNPSPFDPRPGYGTHITRSTTWTTNGYDQGSTNNPSIYYYSAGIWTAPASTNAVKITDNSGCYMLFARGDRSILISNQFVAASPTTLAPKGELNIGDVTIPLAASGYQTVGNPYASEIKLDNIVFNDTLGNRKTIYLWDPKTLGSFNVGKFITCSGDGGSPATYTYTGNTSAYSTKPGVIESSAAFMVKGNGGNIVFHESDKTRESNTIGIASRPASPANSFGRIRKLYTDLFVIKNGVPVLADAVANTYNWNYENSIDGFDASKLTSFTSKEELSIQRDNQLFAIERRKAVAKADTIFLHISKLSLADYQFSFRPIDFDDSYTAFLEDKFLGTVTAFSLTQQSTISFSITGDPASAVNNRFDIIFCTKATQKNITLQAAQQYNDIAVEWVNTNEEDTEANCIERSTDGIHFTSIATSAPVFNSAGAVAQWLDENPLPGIYFYRIRFSDVAGNPAYSNIARVIKSAKAGVPSIMPNPVVNGKIGLYMGNLPEGIYGVRITNSIGQLIYTGNIRSQNPFATELIDLKNKNTKGIYKLEIIAAGKTITTLNVMMQ